MPLENPSIERAAYDDDDNDNEDDDDDDAQYGLYKDSQLRQRLAATAGRLDIANSLRKQRASERGRATAEGREQQTKKSKAKQSKSNQINKTNATAASRL